MKPMPMNPRAARFVLGAALAWVACGCATPRPSGSGIDPVALEQINRMRAVMERTTTYQMDFETLEDEALASGQLVQVGQTAVLKVARPDRLALTAENDSGEKWSAWISGEKLVLVDETQERHSRLDVPAPLDRSLDELGERYGLELPLLDIVSGLRRASLLDRVQTGLYIGTETVAGKECHHLLFRQPVADWQIWIETANPALPRKILITFKDEPNLPVYQATITAWDLAPTFPVGSWEPNLSEKSSEVGVAELLRQEESP